METTSILKALKVALIVAVVGLSTSCKPKQTAAPKLSPAAAEKTSFDEVTAKLDKGGNFYLYLSTEQWLNGLSGKIASWRGFVDALPNVQEKDQQNIGRAFDVVTDLVKSSGVEEVSGVGMSAIAREPGLYYSKVIVHHYKDQDAGWLWSLFGKSAHELNGLEMLPENTGLAVFSDFNTPQVWSLIQKEVSQLGMPEVDKQFKQLPAAFEKMVGMKLDKMLASLGGEYGLVLTLDSTKTISLPSGQDQKLEIPDPALAIIIKVKNDLIFDRIDESMKSNRQIERVDKGDLKMRTMPVPKRKVGNQPNSSKSFRKACRSKATASFL
jgi:hypothetical protein